MEANTTEETDPDLQTQLILLAASKHDTESLRTLLRTGSASGQDPETGFTPLHAAIAACEATDLTAFPTQNDSLANGHATNANANEATEKEEESEIEVAAKTMRLLLQNGAIWNDVDIKNETPGCLALRLELRKLYEIMVDAGVRAEMLLNRLDEYEQLMDVEDEVIDLTGEVVESGSAGAVEEADEVKFEQADPELNTPANQTDLNNENYLQSSLHISDNRIVDSSNNGVMMDWETSIMQRTSDLLVPKPGLRILNIGHGMGIIDHFFQAKSPFEHHIIEAHPSILARMKRDGWYGKPNVTVHEGRWQKVVPKIIEQGVLFDAIYFDTFAEDYKALRDFFSDHIIGLLNDGGKWGFFNGLGADRQICYDVYGKVVEMDLFEAGYDTEWEGVEVPKMENEEWEGVKRRYWVLREYKLPICSFIE